MKINVYKLPCGCIVARDGEWIVEMCACCDKDWAERHTRAQIDRRARHIGQAQAVAA